MKSLKKNNKGISLIEVIVTVTIIAIVIVPLVTGFFTSMEINSDSRRIQNATTIAQSTMEIVKSQSIDEIKAHFTGTGTTFTTSYKEIDKAKRYPIYTIKNYYVEGPDEEDNYVDIVIDSSVYASLEGIEATKNPVNSLTQPEFSSLFGSDAIMVFNQYTVADQHLKTYFAGKMPASDIADMIANPKKVSKSTKMDIICDYNKGLYNYTINLEMTYTYKKYASSKGISVKVSRTVNKTYKTDEGHSLYFMMPPFDIYNKTASDVMKISYNFTKDVATYVAAPKLGVYIAEQSMFKDGSTTETVAINSAKVSIKYKTGAEKSLYSYNNNDYNLKIYTNIKKTLGDTATNDTISGITDSDNLVDSLMYDVTVKVKDSNADNANIITTFSGSKED